MPKVIAISLKSVLVGSMAMAVFSSHAGNVETTKYTFSEQEKSQAAEWNLSKDEYSRFKSLLQSPRAYITPKLEKNPVLALGVMARNQSERQKYADKWVKIQYENNIRTLVWMLEVQNAWDRNYPGIPRFAYGQADKRKYSASSMMNDGQASFNRKKIWLSLDDCSRCESELSSLLLKLGNKSISGLDIFVNDLKASKQNNRRISEWAIKNGIQPDVVQEKIITINYAGSNARPSGSQIPYVK